jgi:hypothetical protein
LIGDLYDDQTRRGQSIAPIAATIICAMQDIADRQAAKARRRDGNARRD